MTTQKEKVMTLQQKAATWVMAKGLGVTVLVCYCIISGYVIKTLYEKMNVLQAQMFELQNVIIKDNTKAMTEFNLRNK